MGFWRSMKRAAALPGKGLASLAPSFLRPLLNKPIIGKSVEEQDRQLAAQKLGLVQAEKNQIQKIVLLVKEIEAGIIPVERMIVDTYPKIKSAGMHAVAAEQFTQKANMLRIVLLKKEQMLEGGKFGASEFGHFVGNLGQLEKELEAVMPELNKVVQITRAEEAEAAKVLQVISAQKRKVLQLVQLYNQVFVEAEKGLQESQKIANNTIGTQQDVGQEILKIRDVIARMARAS